MKPQGFTLMTKVRGDRKELERTLRAKGDGLQNGSVLMFGGLRRLHSLSAFIVEGVNDAPWLVLEVNYDGELRTFLDDLIAHEPDFVDAIYSRCDGYPATGVRDGAAAREYLFAQARSNQAYYVGCPSHTNERIDAEARLGTEVFQLMHKRLPHGRRGDFLHAVWTKLPEDLQDQVRTAPVLPTAPARTELGNLVATSARWSWRGIQMLGFVVFALVGLAAFDAPLAAPFMPSPTLVDAVATWATGLCVVVVALGCAALLFSALLLPKRARGDFRGRALRGAARRVFFATLRAIPGFIAILGIAALYVWAYRVFLVPLAALLLLAAVLVVVALSISLVHVLNERREVFQELTWDSVREAQMRRREDRGPLNHFVGITTIKDTALRLFTVRVVLWAIGFLARFVDERRGLSDITSIHFARWILLPPDPGTKRRRLLFVAHYDGTWAGYLGEFVMHAPRGVTAIWGNTRGCPRHGFGFTEGVTDEQRFKCYARASQVESLLWYTRNPALTVSVIQRNSRIRSLLANVVPGLRRAPAAVSEADVDTLLRHF